MIHWIVFAAIFAAGLVPVAYLLANAALSRRRGRARCVPAARPADITIVIPVHAERPERFEECLRSAARQGGPVRVVGDGSLEPYRSRALAAGAEFIALPKNLGKKRALAAGIATVRTPYVLFVDSDTVLPDGTARTLSTYFEPDVGGVGANLYVRENGSVAAGCAEFVERAREVVLRAMSSRGNVLYLDGACTMYRTELVLPFVLSADFQDLRVLGRPTRLGDDWLLTDHVLAEGYRTVKAYEVGVVTHRPEGLEEFARQNVRWSRSSWIRLGRYLRGEGPENPGLFYRFELAGTYALPLVAFVLGLLRLPLYLRIAGRFLAAALDAVGDAVTPVGGGIPVHLFRPLFSLQMIAGLVGLGAFATAVAVLLPPGRRLRTLAYGTLGASVLFASTIYGLFTFWKAPSWRGPGPPATEGVPATTSPSTLGRSGPLDDR